MIELADEMLQKSFSTLIEMLTEKAIKGDLSSVKLWLELSQKARPQKKAEAEGSGFSQAERWASEPEWPGEASEVGAEMDSGSREPES